MKKLLVASTILLAASAAQAETYKGKTGRFCTGANNSIEIPVEDSYVERVVVAAEGVGRDGFIEAYADGVRVARLGVPGYDPMYTFRVRRNVNKITLDFLAEGSSSRCFNIMNFEAYTPVGNAPTSYDRYEANKVKAGSWGGEVLAIINSLNLSMYTENFDIDPLFTNVLKPLRNISMSEDAAESQRDVKSVIKMQRALEMAKIIKDNEMDLVERLVNGQDDYLMIDLLNIKEDILEHLDVTEEDIESSISYIKRRLQR